jgi:hypothetical protein
MHVEAGSQKPGGVGNRYVISPPVKAMLGREFLCKLVACCRSTFPDNTIMPPQVSAVLSLTVVSTSINVPVLRSTKRAAA